jgi:hypothetical protein
VESTATKKHFIALGAALIAWASILPSASAQAAASLACSPSVIAGGSGDSAICTVTLSAAAPAGGTAVTLTSSLTELAASVPTVTVPEGQTTANFTVATNPGYRRYSQLAFRAIISASANGTTQSATLDVTAQTPPPDFNSGSTAGSNTQWEGLMCGGIAPIGGYPDILYDCSSADETGFGSCTFRQECSIGCRRVPPDGERFNDFCATTGPNPVALSRNYIIGGDRVPATIVAEAPAGSGPAQEQGVPRVIDPNFNSTKFPQSGIPFPDGATSVDFDVATSYVPSIQFVEVGGFWFNDAIPPLLITNGRGGHAWLVMLPPDPPPAVAIPTLGNFRITGLNPVTGGESSMGQIDLSGLSRVGGPTITLTSSHPDIVASITVDAPATEQFFGFQVTIPTQAPAADTDVTVTATDGRYSFSAILTVLVPPPPPVLADLSVDPTSVVGGNPSTGTVTLSAAQSGDTVVTLSTPAPASVATLPSSVTVPAGATSATFSITTSPVTETFNMNIYANLAGSPEQQALLLITPNSLPTVSALSVSPDTVEGGTSSTGTVTLSAAAPSGGAVVSLTSSNSSVATPPASVTVPAGATSATFTVTTAVVTTTTMVTLTAVFNNTGRTADLRVTAPPGGGFNSPSANARDSGGDGNGFESNPSNAHADDAANASDINSGSGTGTSCTSSGKDRHRFYNYGLSIPTDVPITGIEVRLDARADSTSGSPKMCVQLSWDGGANWTAAKATATLGTSMTTFTLGSATDTWGRTWSPTNFTDASFRVRVINVASSTARDFFLDWIAVRPHYTASGPASLSAVSVSPSTVTGGDSSIGTVTLTATAPSEGAVVSLMSSNTSVATVPTSVTVAAGATSASFTVTTQTVATSTTLTISATYSGVTKSTTLTVQPQSGDTVSIQRAEYDNQKAQLRVEATSTSGSATLKVFVSSTDELIGTLTNDGGGRYSGQFSVATNPQSITVRSSLGGSATSTVTTK